jgi:plasmid stabilization system protein ParE
MAHRLAPQARAELSSIWAYIVKQGGSVAAADGVIDAITERFYLLGLLPADGRMKTIRYGGPTEMVSEP